MKKFFTVVFFIAVSQLAGAIGSIFTVSSVKGWYNVLNKPFFNPPSWIFGPVWIILYFMMGWASYLVYKEVGKNKSAKGSLVLFFIHLVFNASWSVVFFGLHSPWWAFVNIVILWGMILFLIFRFYGISRVASYLLVPYLLWVSFASVLNFSIWWLN